MRRIFIGVTTALTVWLGSTLVAEAQGTSITPIGPTAYLSGSTTSTYTANIYLPTPMSYKVNTCIYKNGVYQTMISTQMPNPGTNNTTINQQCDVTFSVVAGDVVRYEAQLLYNRTTTNAAPWSVTVTNPPYPRPSKKSSVSTGTDLAKRTGLELQSIDRDRRRE
jgi:hypothetical protein